MCVYLLTNMHTYVCCQDSQGLNIDDGICGYVGRALVLVSASINPATGKRKRILCCLSAVIKRVFPAILYYVQTSNCECQRIESKWMHMIVPTLCCASSVRSEQRRRRRRTSKQLSTLWKALTGSGTCVPLIEWDFQR